MDKSKIQELYLIPAEKYNELSQSKPIETSEKIIREQEKLNEKNREDRRREIYSRIHSSIPAKLHNKVVSILPYLKQSDSFSWDQQTGEVTSSIRGPPSTSIHLAEFIKQLIYPISILSEKNERWVREVALVDIRIPVRLTSFFYDDEDD